MMSFTRLPFEDFPGEMCHSNSETEANSKYSCGDEHGRSTHRPVGAQARAQKNTASRPAARGGAVVHLLLVTIRLLIGRPGRRRP